MTILGAIWASHATLALGVPIGGLAPHSPFVLVLVGTIGGFGWALWYIRDRLLLEHQPKIARTAFAAKSASLVCAGSVGLYAAYSFLNAGSNILAFGTGLLLASFTASGVALATIVLYELAPLPTRASASQQDSSAE